MPNRLAAERSLYLRQHADNPVDWYPWGDEAFTRARQEDRPLLVSVGYSACHWCHVMAHESFEDDDTAALVNALFVNVKVDRDERPDVDALYMQATMALTGHGGWPMTVFLTPDGHPYFAGTYFPPEARGGLPAFADVCRAVAQAYRTQRDDVAQQTGVVMERVAAVAARTAPHDRPLDEAYLRTAMAALEDRFDPVYGGFGPGPKFPPTAALELLVQRIERTAGDTGARLMLDLTLTRMAEGGIHDHLGGGFHRYAVDGVWGVPHFEKMLYDNAGLARVYAQAHAATGDPAWAAVATGTLEYLLREMRLPGGAFASAQDADTPAGEGAYFTWTADEIVDVLPEDEARVVRMHYGIVDHGPLEGRSVLAVARPIQAVAALTRTDAAALLADAHERMREARSARPAPGRDDAAITAWNGLAIAAFADAGVVLGRADFVEAARVAAAFVCDHAWVDGRLHRTLHGDTAQHDGNLDDHAHLAFGLVRLHQATADARWLREAGRVVDAMLERFGDEDGTGFYRAPRDGEQLVARTRDLEDHPATGGNSQAARVLLQLGALRGDPDMVERGRRVVDGVAGDALRFPQAFGTALAAADLAAHDDPVVAIAGDDPDGVGAMRDAARAHGGPGVLVVTEADAALTALLDQRPARDGRATAYVCHGTVCDAPVTDLSSLAEALARHT